MEREQILERYADVLAAESTKEAFLSPFCGPLNAISPLTYRP